MRPFTHLRTCGVTLIELVMVMILIGILAGAGSYLLVAFVDQAVYLPVSLEMAQVRDRALDLILEGDDQAGGLRYARSIRRARTQFLRYSDQDGRDVQLRFRRGRGYFQRSINGGAWIDFPQISDPNLKIAPSAGTTRVFRYYDQNFNVTNRANRVRFVRVECVVEHQKPDAFTPSPLTVLSGMSVNPFP